MNLKTITFSGTPIHRQFQQEFKNLYEKNLGEIISYTGDWLETTQFYKDNPQIFQYQKYFGYFLWKPYLIDYSLSQSDADVVLYCDSNVRFVNLAAYIDKIMSIAVKEGVFFVKHTMWINKEWTKRDTFILMDADHEKYWNSYQLWTPILAFTKTKKSLEILEQYLKFCKIPEAVTDLPNKYGDNLPEFREHRWEQSILSILAEKYNINGMPDLEAFNYATKIYNKELYDMKERVNADPLKVIE